LKTTPTRIGDNLFIFNYYVVVSVELCVSSIPHLSWSGLMEYVVHNRRVASK
jgi:hypothetical protein